MLVAVTAGTLSLVIYIDRRLAPPLALSLRHEGVRVTRPRKLYDELFHKQKDWRARVGRTALQTFSYTLLCCILAVFTNLSAVCALRLSPPAFSASNARNFSWKCGCATFLFASQFAQFAHFPFVGTAADLRVIGVVVIYDASIKIRRLENYHLDSRGQQCKHT